MRNRLGGLLALATAAGALAARIPAASPLPSSAREAQVLLAMADHPAVFTAAPTGWRVLSPALAHALGPGERGFPLLAAGALLAAGLAFFGLLRRLGFALVPSLLGVALLVGGPPAAAALRDPWRVEPLGLLLGLAFLWAVEAALPPGVPAVVLGLAALDDPRLLLAALVLVAGRLGTHGPRAAAQAGWIVAAPALASLFLQRVWWAPLAADPAGPPPVAGAALLRGDGTAAAVFVALLTLLATVGLFTRGGRALGGRWAPLVVLAGLLLALRPPAPTLLYAVPPLLVMVLTLVDRGAGAALPPPATQPSALSRLAGLAMVLVVIAPVLLLDRYRRVNLGEDASGLLVRETCRGSLAAAAELEAGRPVTLEGRGRWPFFLRGGWGPESAGATPVTAGGEAVLLVPGPGGRPLRARLELVPADGRPVRLAINTLDLGERALQGPGTLEVVLPAEALVRGDNRLALRATPGLRLGRLTVLP